MRDAAIAQLLRAHHSIEHFDDTDLTTEEVHYFLGESAAVAFYQYRFLQQFQN